MLVKVGVRAAEQGRSAADFFPTLLTDQLIHHILLFIFDDAGDQVERPLFAV